MYKVYYRSPGPEGTQLYGEGYASPTDAAMATAMCFLHHFEAIMVFCLKDGEPFGTALIRPDDRS